MNKITLLACLAAGSYLLTGCETYGDDKLFPEQYHKALNFKDGGERPVTFYTTGEDGTTQFSVMKSGSDGDFSLKATIGAMSESDFKIYSEANYFNYAYLPADYYSLSEKDLSFSDTERYKILTATFKTDAMKQLFAANSGKKYALPLLLSSSEATVKDSLLLFEPTVLTPSVKFVQPGFFDALKFESDGANSGTISNKLTLGITNKWSFNASVAVDDAAKAAFNAYNTANGNKYVILPSEAYSLPAGGNVAFKEGTDSVPLNISVDRSKLQRGFYILPLSITDVTKEGFDVDATNKTMMAGITYMPDRIQLSVDQLSENSPCNYDGQGLPGLIDGYTNTFYHTDYFYGYGHDPVYGNYIDVALKQPVQSIMFEYWTRLENGNGAPTYIEVYASNDGKDWTKLGTANSGLPTTGNTKYTSNIFQSTFKFTHFRFAVIQGVGGDQRQGGYFNLAELALYGN